MTKMGFWDQFSDLAKVAFRLRKENEQPKQLCLHKACMKCHGSGVDKDGMTCIHMISCPCPNCTPRY